MGFPARSVRRLALAWLALAGIAVLSAGPVVLGHPSADAECVPALSGAHDHSAHRLRAAPDASADHCIACHLTRSASGASPSTTGVAAAAGERADVEISDRSARTLARLTAFTRGPPSRL
jgi:hypothetical protein